MASDTTVVVVWDGFRREDMSRNLTPNLVAMGERGTVFGESRCAYPSLTRVNCASLATASWPSGHGLVGNKLYVPEIDSSGASSLASEAVIEALAGLRGGRLFGDRPSLGEVLADSGRTFMVASAASPGSSTILGWGSTAMIADGLPVPELLEDAVATFGLSPGRQSPDPTALNRYIVRVATEHLIPICRPDVLLVWLGEPDASQHRYGLDDDRVRDAIRANDELLGEIVSAVGPEGHVIVTSDHGHTSADVQAARTSDHLDRVTGLRHGEDYVMTSDGVYLRAPSRAAVSRVVAGLRSIDSVGAVFVKLDHPDAMSMAGVQLGGPWAPDVKYSHRSNLHPDSTHTIRVGAECEYRSTHGSIEPSDMRNLLVAAGPAFRAGHVSDIPSGIVDIGPTVLNLVGVPVPPVWDGRSLGEALVGGDTPAVVDATLESVWQDDGRRLEQVVKRASVDGTTYVLSGFTTTHSLSRDAARA